MTIARHSSSDGGIDGGGDVALPGAWQRAEVDLAKARTEHEGNA
ncbi:MAG: hypothetical protein V2I43_20350 [Parvularcula sp.]|nr:hypothetical protein [Parvularcula sp.]